jgi:hypothetical protein
VIKAVGAAFGSGYERQLCSQMTRTPIITVDRQQNDQKSYDLPCLATAYSRLTLAASRHSQNGYEFL